MRNEPVPPMAAVFPLPGSVLFPKVLLPLRIFEPRYKTMLRDLLDSHGWIAIGLQKFERELDEKGEPDVFPVAGLGRLVDYQKAEDGTYKIVVLGEHRVRLRGWLQVKPYAIAKLERLPELEPEGGTREDLRGRLRARIKDLVRQSADSQVLMLLDQTIKECEEIGPLVDSIAYHFLQSPKEKQRLLETSDTVEREQLLIELLKRERLGDRAATLDNEVDLKES